MILDHPYRTTQPQLNTANMGALLIAAVATAPLLAAGMDNGLAQLPPLAWCVLARRKRVNWTPHFPLSVGLWMLRMHPSMIHATAALGVVRIVHGRRSWNAFHTDFNQSTIMGMVDAITEKRTPPDGGAPISLQELGYNTVGTAQCSACLPALLPLGHAVACLLLGPFALFFLACTSTDVRVFATCCHGSELAAGIDEGARRVPTTHMCTPKIHHIVF